MQKKPAASTSWKHPLLTKLATARSSAANGTVDMLDALSGLVHQLGDNESTANRDYWTRMVDQTVAGEFESLGHLASKLPRFMILSDEWLRTAAANYERATRTPSIPPKGEDVSAMESRRRYGRPLREPTSAELRLAALGTHADGNIGWNIRDAR